MNFLARYLTISLTLIQTPSLRLCLTAALRQDSRSLMLGIRNVAVALTLQRECQFPYVGSRWEFLLPYAMKASKVVFCRVRTEPYPGY